MPYFFISYSHNDSDDFVDRFRADLQAAGIPVWIDRLGLKPGTPDWEQALRDAITHATGLLLVATTSSRASRYVRDELAMAEMNETPILPIWAKGVDGRYVECIPFGFSSIQNVDARGSRYDAGLEELLKRLRELLKMQGKPARRIKPTGFLPEPRNPYKGLVAFQEGDRGDFFGRETIIDHFLTALHRNPRFLAVVGASGSGKSSAVRAGLLPRLREGVIEGNWQIMEPIAPGDRPLEHLAFLLKKYLPERVTTATILDELNHKSARGLHYLGREIADEQEVDRVLLTIDQFEEIFAQTRDEHERRHFIDLLTTAVNEPSGGLSIIITLRADFYHHTHNYAELVELIDHHKQSMLPMTLAELADAVQRPAALPDVMLEFESQLVQEIVFALRAQAQSNETAALAGALPLLQFTLERLFAARDGRSLTLEAYRAMGGVQGAIGTHAEEVFNTLDAEAQAALPSIFLKLVNMDERNEPTRRRTALEGVLQTPAMERLVEALIEGRLLITGMDEQENPTIEVAHEALLRNWSRLSEWLKSVATDLQLRNRVVQEAYEWHSARRPAFRLWTHERLAPVYNMQRRSGIQFDNDAIVQDFIRPEWERLLEEFRYPQTKSPRRATIIDRLISFGEEAVPTLVQLIPYATEHIDMLADALKPFIRLTLPLLKPLVQDKNPEIRRRTVLILGNMQSSGGLPLLLFMTKDPQPSVRRSAVEALGKLGDKQSTGTLITALRDKDAGVRGSAAEALGIIGVPEAARILSPLFNDPDESVRRKATIALQHMSQSQPNEPVLDNEMFKTITTTRDVDVLISGLYHDDARIRSRAGLALSRYKGERTVGALLQVLQSENASARYEAARTLGRMNEARSTPLLINALQDPDTAVRRIAAAALGQNADDRAIEPLIQAARFDTDSAVRRNAAASVRQIRDRIASTTHEFPAVVAQAQQQAAKSLPQTAPLTLPDETAPHTGNGSAPPPTARVGAKTAPLPPLESAMPKKGTTARLSPPDKLPLSPKPSDSTDPTNPKRQARSVHSGRSLPEILADATHSDYRVRWKAADELSQLNEIEPLMRLLGDTSDVLRAFVARRLGEMQATRGVDMLIHVLMHDRDETVRRTAAISLKHIGTPEARAALAHYQRQQQT